MKTTNFIIIICAFLTMWPLPAYMMSSTSYRIGWDSINIGGADATSTDYKGQDTVGEIATGESQSTSYKIKAGYQQMEPSTISVTATDSVNLSPDIPAITGGTANGDGTIHVTTNDRAGYQLKLTATTTPALKSSSDSFADYLPASPPTPDYNWTLASASSRFGFTVWGQDAAQSYLSTPSSCNQSGGSANGTKCWNGLSGAAPITIAMSASANVPSGTDTNVKFQAQVKSNGFQKPDSYSALITVTATTN